MQYVLQSKRLGMRQWQDSDRSRFAKMNQDPRVMEFFPKVFTPEESAASQLALAAHYNAHGFTYFAVDLMPPNGSSEGGEFIGFIGLKLQTFAHPLSPFVDVGWRLSPEAWGRGLATEGARECLRFGFERFGFQSIYAVAPALNKRSTRVMAKLGMRQVEQFLHPLMPPEHRLNPCDLYRITRQEFPFQPIGQ